MTASRAPRFSPPPLTLVEPEPDGEMMAELAELDDLCDQLDALARQSDTAAAWHWWRCGFEVALVLCLLGILIGGGAAWGWAW